MEQPEIINASERTIKTVLPLPDFKLLLEFDNGENRIYDVTPLLKYEAFAALRDELFFRQVHVIYQYTIGWNHEIDLCPSCLYNHSMLASDQN